MSRAKRKNEESGPQIGLSLARKMKKKGSKLDVNGTGYCASFNFRRTARAVTRLYDLALQGAGVRSTQFSILVGIAKNQPVAVGRLADVMMLDSTTRTRS